jgi:RNA polymerase sigma factor (TIGR02999 family)
MIEDDTPGDRADNEPGGTPRAHTRGDVARILSAIEQGDGQASEQLLPLVYDELRKLATAKMAQEKPGQTLQATALVHEAYLRLVDGKKAQHWNSRGHFFLAAAEAMRRILVENARRKTRKRHGGEYRRVDFDHTDLACEMPSDELLALDEALGKLAAVDPLTAKLVHLRFFVGLSNEEVAGMLEVSAPTACRYWRYARAWLHAALREPDDSRSS